MKNILYFLASLLGILRFSVVYADLPPSEKSAIQHELTILVEKDTVYVTYDMSTEAARNISRIDQLSIDRPIDYSVAADLHHKTLGYSPLIVSNDICVWKSIGAKYLGSLHQVPNSDFIRVWGILTCPNTRYMGWDAEFTKHVFPPYDLKVKTVEEGFSREFLIPPATYSTRFDIIRPGSFVKSCLIPIKRLFVAPSDWNAFSLTLYTEMLIHIFFMYMISVIYRKKIDSAKLVLAMFCGQALSLLFYVRHLSGNASESVWFDLIPIISFVLLLLFGLASFRTDWRKTKPNLDVGLVFSGLFGVAIGFKFFPLVFIECAGRNASILAVSGLSLGILSLSTIALLGISACEGLGHLLVKRGLPKQLSIVILVISYFMILSMTKTLGLTVY
jgi:hypothetical protein